MTPAQEAALLQATAAGLDDSLREALADLIEKIGAGAVPRDAVQAVVETFVGDFAEIMRTALGALLGAAVGASEVLEIKVGQVALSRHLYAEAGQVSEVVHGIVQRHVHGVQDARRLALELFEGYGFRDPAAEPLKLSPRNDKLPKYLREALLSDPQVKDDMARAFAKIQASGLTTGPLRAAYSELLEAIDGIEDDSAKALLDRKMRTAFFERMRYFATRIARTELHRAYAEREAAMLMDDEDVEYVQVRRGSDHDCICTLIAGRNQYGMGAGVYPKRLAPKPPYHPFCLPGDTLISTAVGIAAVSKRWFDGDLAVITTASGKRLSATVNHPVLTVRGWVGAGMLHVGDQVLSRVEAVPVSRNTFRHDQHQDVPASIAEIADTFFSARKVSSREVPEAAEHFHGDGVRGQVAVVGADRELWDGVETLQAKVVSDHALERADAGAACLLGKRVLDLGGEALGDATHCGMCGGRKRAALLGREGSHAESLLVAGGTFESALPGDTQVNDVAADAELARQIQDGATGPVFADDVLVVERMAYAGHVFNLETEGGHYTSNGIVTHNCRCVLSPLFNVVGKPKLNEAADRSFLHSVGDPIAAKVMGSKAKRDMVLGGKQALDIVNARTEPAYRIQPAGVRTA